MKNRDAIVVLVILWLLWKRGQTWSDVNMCWVNPDTGECKPVLVEETLPL